MDVAISGSSGLIGTALRTALTEAGHRPIRLVRRDPQPGADEIRFEPAKGEIDAASLEGVDAVVNLAGAGVGDARWTEQYRRLLVDSRVDTTRLLTKTITSLNDGPQVFLSGSAIGYYGNQGDTVLTEESPAASDFLAQLCVDWEAAAAPAQEAGIRTAFLRTGIVLAPHGGALQRLLPLFKLGLGGPLGSGKQYMSWITLADEVEAILHLLTHDVSGPVNLTGPEPVTNAEFTKALASAVSRPAFLPVPSFAPKLALGSDRGQALALDSIRVLPEVLKSSGYSFESATIAAGLAAELG
jgi:uncharacterized protein (TIGR01777 family)